MMYLLVATTYGRTDCAIVASDTEADKRYIITPSNDTLRHSLLDHPIVVNVPLGKKVKWMTAAHAESHDDAPPR